MAKTKKLIFQDFDFHNNEILNPSSISNEHSEISMSKENNLDKLTLTSDKVLIEKDDHSLSLTENEIEVKSSNLRINGKANIIEKTDTGDIEKISIDKNFCDIKDVNFSINNTENKEILIKGISNLEITSNQSDSKITSNKLEAKDVSKAPSFSVKDKVFISWDDASNSLIFTQG